MRFLLVFILFSLFSSEILAQTQVKDSIPTKKDRRFDPLSPSRAAFYSAIVPGLGQAYNKKYWKIPVVYAALGTSIYFYADNNKQYKRYRTAFKLREAGQQDEFTLDDGTETLSRDVLIRGQQRYRRDRDLALLVTIGIYALQVVEASVNAHLLNFNTDRNLSVRPQLIHDTYENAFRPGLNINFRF